MDCYSCQVCSFIIRHHVALSFFPTDSGSVPCRPAPHRTLSPPDKRGPAAAQWGCQPRGGPAVEVSGRLLEHPQVSKSALLSTLPHVKNKQRNQNVISLKPWVYAENKLDSALNVKKPLPLQSSQIYISLYVQLVTLPHTAVWLYVHLYCTCPGTPWPGCSWLVCVHRGQS